MPIFDPKPFASVDLSGLTGTVERGIANLGARMDMQRQVEQLAAQRRIQEEQDRQAMADPALQAFLRRLYGGGPMDPSPSPGNALAGQPGLPGPALEAPIGPLRPDTGTFYAPGVNPVNTSTDTRTPVSQPERPDASLPQSMGGFKAMMQLAPQAMQLRQSEDATTRAREKIRSQEQSWQKLNASREKIAEMNNKAKVRVAEVQKEVQRIRNAGKGANGSTRLKGMLKAAEAEFASVEKLMRDYEKQLTDAKLSEDPPPPEKIREVETQLATVRDEFLKARAALRDAGAVSDGGIPGVPTAAPVSTPAPAATGGVPARQPGESARAYAERLKKLQR